LPFVVKDIESGLPWKLITLLVFIDEGWLGYFEAYRKRRRGVREKIH